MELSRSWEAASCAVTQEFPNILWNLKVHNRVHKNPVLVLILSQIKPAHTTPSYLRCILILSTQLHLLLGLPSGLFPSYFPTNILCAFLYPMCIPFLSHSGYMPCPSHPWLEHSNLAKITSYGARYAILKLFQLEKIFWVHFHYIEVFRILIFVQFLF
jgi:hypothetical protein